MLTNVIPFDVSDEDAKDEKVEEFNRLYTRYLKAKARASNNLQSERACAAALDVVRRIVWEIVKTPAILTYQVHHKLEVLADMLEGSDPSWTDRRERALLCSISCDVEE
jgi:hypothetical protein